MRVSVCVCGHLNVFDPYLVVWCVCVCTVKLRVQLSVTAPDTLTQRQSDLQQRDAVVEEFTTPADFHCPQDVCATGEVVLLLVCGVEVVCVFRESSTAAAAAASQ